ncbi:MAG: DUF58 domain-containing protein [Ruminococcaceae bacterium]|nr:DUF58 domain-containing protein [Oscillospiraceae bacterium]
MIYFAILVAMILVIIIQTNIYKKYSFEKLEYKISLSTDEVFEDEEIYMYEEIRNNKFLPLPFVKVDTELPEGLSFHIAEKDEKTGIITTSHPRVISSLFVLRGKQIIRRRWRVCCDVRGVYHLGNVSILADNVFGSNQLSKVIEADEKNGCTLVVLPKAVMLEKHFAPSKYTNGEFLVHSSLLSDPLLKAGVREYSTGDPMNRINWTQTAAHNRLMVNLEEYSNRQAFNIIMNMQARDIEKTIPGPPSGKVPVELCVTVAASILDAVSGENIPVRFISNTNTQDKRELQDENEAEVHVADRIFVSEEFRGKISMISALRMLSQLELYISVPIEKMLDDIVANPYMYVSGGNIVFISSYLSERMINFCYNMRRMGITVIFYITTSQNALIIPSDIEVHFKTHIEE